MRDDIKSILIKYSSLLHWSISERSCQMDSLWENT